MKIAAVIIAGGKSSRMGRDKALVDLAGRIVIRRIIERIAPQVAGLAINANDERFAHLDLPVIKDIRHEIGTPLAGIHAGLVWAKANGFDALVTVPSDSPFLPPDLVARLAGEGPSIAASGGYQHFLTGFWPVDLADGLESTALHRVQDFARSVLAAEVAWPTEPYDPFFNINRPEDLAEAERIAAEFVP
jgi:molybdopterin-guanine dinucleotide biosynthesis protein A